MIFVDSEGTPMQELSALEMDFNTREIVDAFHAHAYSPEPDAYARNHIHGLSFDFLRKHGYPKPYQMIDAFKTWLRGKNYLLIYGNNPTKEVKDLKLNISDIDLDKWAVRTHRPYHKISFLFKKFNIPISSKRCYDEAHSAYKNVIVRPHNMSDIAKRAHGHHCSLYDCYEMYLCYISS